MGHKPHLCIGLTNIQICQIILIFTPVLMYPIGTVSANSTKFCQIRPRMYIEIYFDNAGDNVTMTLYKVTLTSQKTCLTQ